MEKVTVYARSIDHETWEWARIKAKADRTSLARVVVDALRQYRNQCDATTDREQFER